MSDTTQVLLDTNILLHELIPEGRPTAVSALSLAELGHGVVAAVRAGDAVKVRGRMNDLHRARTFYGEGIPFTGAMAEAYGQVVEVARATPGLGPRRLDYLIVATAVHHGMAFMTTDRGLAAFETLTEVVVVEPRR